MSPLLFVIPVMGLIVAVATLVKTKESSPALMIIMASAVLTILVSPNLISKLANYARGTLEEGHGEPPSGGDPSGSSSSSQPSESPSPSAAPSSSPEQPPPDASPPPWEWIGFVVVGLIAAVIVVLLAVLLVKASRKAAAKRKIAKRKAIEQQKLRARHLAEWSDLLIKEKALGSRWLEYEDSPELSLRYPIMRQTGDPKIAPVIAAMGRAKAYRTEEPPDLDRNPVETEYAKAISQFETALNEAERYAKKVRWNNFAPDERKKAKQALNHLKRAMDTRNYPAERKLAYERVAKIMEDLMIPVTPRALLAIEESVGRLELTS